MSNPRNVQKCHVALSPLNFPHMRTVNPSRISKRFLGEGLLRSTGTHSLSQTYQALVLILSRGDSWHAANRFVMLLKRPRYLRPISLIAQGVLK